MNNTDIHEELERLKDDSSLFQTEIWAINKAEDQLETINECGSVKICRQRLPQINNDTRHSRQAKEIKLGSWSTVGKSHVGIRGNETAENDAKRAKELEETKDQTSNVKVLFNYWERTFTD